MDQTETLETFENLLLNSVQSRNQAGRMLGSQGYYSILTEPGIPGNSQGAILVWTDPARDTGGFSPYYRVDELFEAYESLDREDQRDFFAQALDAVASGMVLSVLEETRKKKRDTLPDREYLLANVYPAVIPYSGNEEPLKHVPNRSAGETDIRIYYYVKTDCTFQEKGDMDGFLLLTNEVLEEANRGTRRKLTEETIYRAARENIARETKVEGGLERLLRQLCESEGVPVEEAFTRVHPPKVESLYYIYTPDLPCGAAAAFTLCGIDEVEDKWGNSPAYFIPMSRSEVCVRLTNGISEMTKLTFEQEVRNQNLSPQDRLSDSIYYYEPKKKRLTIEAKGSGVLYDGSQEKRAAAEPSTGAHTRTGRSAGS